MGKASTTARAEIPNWLEDAAKRNLRQAELVSKMGSIPLTYGPTVAAFTPMQNAAFANTADMATMLGLAAPQDAAAIGGNMPPAENYGGVTAYSGKPLYDSMTGEFIGDRPGQANYLDSFFIDPVTGQTVAASPNTLRATSSGNPMMQGAVAQSRPRSSERFQRTADRMPKFREKDMRTVAGYESLGELDYNARATDYIDGMDTPGHLSLIGGDLENIALAASKGPKPFGIGDPSYRIGGTNNPQNNPSLAAMVAGAPDGMRYDPTTGGYKAIKGYGEGQDIKSLRPQIRGTPSKDLSTPAQDAEAKEGCVIATHALSTGAYNYKVRREAEIWCMRKLHNQWWGEAIRRGYRYLGRRKIEQGKAQEHYDEFRRYIDFARGKKRNLKGALTFTLRSIQFFAVGLFARNS